MLAMCGYCCCGDLLVLCARVCTQLLALSTQVQIQS